MTKKRIACVGGILFGLAFGSSVARSPGAATLQEGARRPADPVAIIAELEKKIAGQENKPAEEVFKNIQTLKGQPALRVLRIMAIAFNPGLGVDCAHCHVPDQWERDDKEAKQTARKMWQMQRNINSELKASLGRGVVNCYTCHRGQTKPALSPTPAK